MRWIVLFTLAAAAVQAQETDLTPEQEAVLKSARAFASQYTKSLPNFICTQVVQRNEDRTDNGRWRTLDTLTVKLSYSGREEYKLMARNGVPTQEDFRMIAGATSSGEFGSRLLDIFARESAAEFTWKGWAHVRHKRVAVFGYRVEQEHSRNVIRYETRSIIAGYHGEVSVDPETGNVIRVSLVGDMPAGFPINACSSWTEYDYRPVAGNSYLLPVESETRLTSGRYRASNHIEFKEYRKFQTEATITFK